MIHNSARNNNLCKIAHFIAKIHFFDFSNFERVFWRNLKKLELNILFVYVYVHINAILHGKDDKVIFRCDIIPQK